VIELAFFRDGKCHRIEITAASFPPELAISLAFDRLGFRVKELTSALANKFGLTETKGVVIVDIQKGSQAEKIGLEPSDLVRGVNDATITSEEDFKEAIIKFRLKKQITVLVQRGWTVYSIPFKM
jgi:S1-C subfamily serine protease